MTINTTTTRVSYTGDGVTTAFAVPFVFFGASELEVISRVIATGAETVLALTTNYTVSGGNGSTGTVTAIVAPAATVQWVIRRKTARTQLVDYAPNDPFPADTHERALDRLTAQTQELGEDVDRSVKFAKSDPALSSELPNSVTRANKLAGFDATGALTVYDPASLTTTGAIYADYLRSQFSGDGVATVFTLPADPLTRDNTWVYISGVYQQKDRYTVSGTTLTFLVAPPLGTNNIEVMQGQGVVVAAAPPPDNSIGSTTLIDGAVTTPKMADGAVTARKESDDAWASVASAGTVDLGAINSRNALITGTTTITSLGNTGAEGRSIRVRFAGVLTLTHNGTTLILPTGANITTAAGDTAIFIKESGASAWRCVDYLRANGQALAVPALASGLTFISSQTASASATVDFTTGISATYDEYEIRFDAVVPATNNAHIIARVTTNAGSTWEATSYRGTEFGVSVAIASAAAGPTTEVLVTGTNALVAGISNTAANGGASGIVRFRPNNSAGKKNIESVASYMGNSNFAQSFCSGQWNGANTVLNGIRFLMNTGNIASGTFRLYGVQRV